MKTLVVGANGMLGTDLVAELEKRSHKTTSVDIQELDITDPTAVARIGAGEFGDLDWCLKLRGLHRG